MQHKRLEHRFVERIPESLDIGVLYVSLNYATAAHLCCCGCGEEVVTPFTPTDWAMTFDGEAVSLRPSIGNWTLECRSHYLVHHGRVIAAGTWTDREIAAERRRDSRAKAQYYQSRSQDAGPDQLVAAEAGPTRHRFWHHVRRWVGFN